MDLLPLAPVCPPVSLSVQIGLFQPRTLYVHPYMLLVRVVPIIFRGELERVVVGGGWVGDLGRISV